MKSVKVYKFDGTTYKTSQYVEFNDGGANGIVMVDDGCYLCAHEYKDGYQWSLWIYPELLKFLKTLPDNPTDLGLQIYNNKDKK